MPTVQGTNDITLNPATVKAVFSAWLTDTLKGGPFEVTEFGYDGDDTKLVFKPATPATEKK